MKKLFIAFFIFLIAFFISFIAVYLLGSFYNASFNLRTWSEASRIVACILTVIATVVTLLVSSIIEEDDEEWCRN